MAFAIHRDPGYYAGTLNVAAPGLLTSEWDGKAITTATEAEAEVLCIMLNDTGPGPYMLSHGQASAPHHEVAERPELPVRYTLRQAMRVLLLHYDFLVDGSRTDVAPEDLDFAALDREFS